MIYFFYFELAAVILLSLISDIKTYTVKNMIVFPFIVLGLISNYLYLEVDGLCSSLVGMIAPIIFLFIFFVLNMLGAGDIKLFSAIGSIMGLNFVLYSILYSFIAGGIIAIGILIARKIFKTRIKHIRDYFLNCFLTFSIKPYQESFENKESVFHFTYAIVFGTIATIVFSAL